MVSRSVQLQEYDHYANRIEVELDSFSVAAEYVADDSSPEPEGVFKLIQEQIVAFFRHGPGMNLVVGTALYEDLDRVRAEHRRADSRSHLRLIVDGSLAHELAYTPVDWGIPPELDFTAFWEPEDDDFFLFLSNVLSDPVRRDRCFPGRGGPASEAPPGV